MENNGLKDTWDKLGYKRVVLAILIIFGTISPSIGILFVRKPLLFGSLEFLKIIALSCAMGMPFIITNIFLGIGIAYLFFFKVADRPLIHEDRIARLTLTSSLLTSSLALNGVLGLACVFEKIALLKISGYAFFVNILVNICFQLLLLSKVGIKRHT